MVWNGLVGDLVGAVRDDSGLGHFEGVARFKAAVVEEVEWKRDETVGVDDELDETEDDVGGGHGANVKAWGIQVQIERGNLLDSQAGEIFLFQSMNIFTLIGIERFHDPKFEWTPSTYTI